MMSFEHPRSSLLLRGSIAFALVAAVLITGLPAAAAFPSKLSPNGQLDFSYGASAQSAGGNATTAKPESKLFYTGDGVSEGVRWWAVLGTSGPTPAAGAWLFELVNHAWVARTQLPGADPWAKADTVFDAATQTLYVSTRDDGSTPRQSSLYKIPYLGNGTFGAVSGPFAITTNSVEALTIAVDTLGRVWTAFEQGGVIKVGHTATGGTSFTFAQVSTTKVASDDIAAITAFSGKIGVYWSDQNARKDFFAWRSDGDGLNAAWTVETAYGGGVGGCPASALCADDHMNVKVVGNDVYVAAKTGLNNGGTTNPADPLIVLLHRDAAGTWSSFPVSTVQQDATRPVTVLSPQQNAIWVFAQRGSEIDVWESSFTSPGFTTNGFVPWISNSGSTNDPTTTRQPTTSTTGTVVEASVGGSKAQYWHNEFLPTVTPVGPSVSGFSPTSGPVGTSVTISGSGFTGTSDVQFNGTSVGPGGFTEDSDTQITATVPQSASTGPISVVTPGGTGTSASNFEVTTSQPGTISEVQSKKASASGVSISATLTSPPTPGDVLVAVVAVPQAGTPIFDTPAGWTAPFTPARGAVFWKASDGSEQTVTVNMSAGQSAKALRMWVIELSGVDTSNAFDRSGSAIVGSATTAFTPTTDGPTAQANEWAIAVAAHNGDNGGGVAASNGFTVLASDSRSIAATKVLDAAGIVSTSLSWTTARAGSWIIATFRAA